MFFDQKADGILGMGMSKHLGAEREEPIYEAMHDAGVIDKKLFNICLGNNGGFMQIGGYQEEKMLQKPIWFKLDDSRDHSYYRFDLKGVSMHDHLMPGSEEWNIAFVDSGTTYSYVPMAMWESL